MAHYHRTNWIAAFAVSHKVDVLAVEELTAQMVSRPAAAGLEQLPPFPISIPGLVRQGPGCGPAGR